MLPARAAWPPNNFTPRRLLSLSRPLRELPPAFLCAIVNYFALVGLELVVFLAAALAGAASFVDAFAAGLASALAGAAFFGAAVLAFSGLALAWSSGAGFSVTGASTWVLAGFSALGAG